MKTYYIKPGDCEDLGGAYKIKGDHYKGNLIIDVDKPIIVKGDQRVKGHQIVKGGKAIVGHCKWVVYYTKTSIKIGCETKTTKEWDKWFKSDEVFETPRNSLAFNQIYKAFLMAKAAQDIDEGII